MPIAKCRLKKADIIAMSLEPQSRDPIELEASVEDVRPRVDPPPPVSLVAVGDCHLPCLAGQWQALDAFYLGILRFERDADDGLVYRAENFRLRFEILEMPPEHEDYRPLRVVVPSLAELIQTLFELEIEFTHQRGLTPGSETVLVRDPAGNLVEASDSRGLLF